MVGPLAANTQLPEALDFSRHPDPHLSQGVVDLVTMKGITWNGEELGASFDIGDIPAGMQEQVINPGCVRQHMSGFALCTDCFAFTSASTSI